MGLRCTAIPVVSTAKQGGGGEVGQAHVWPFPGLSVPVTKQVDPKVLSLPCSYALGYGQSARVGSGFWQHIPRSWASAWVALRELVRHECCYCLKLAAASLSLSCLSQP